MDFENLEIYVQYFKCTVFEDRSEYSILQSLGASKSCRIFNLDG